MKNFFIGSFVILIIIFGFFTVRAESEVSDNDLDLSAFESIGSISDLNILVPTVVDIPISFKDGAIKNILVIQNPDNEIVPAELFSDHEEIKMMVEDSVGSRDVNNLIDGQSDNYTEYLISGDGEKSEIEINFNFSKNVSLSSLSFQLDNYVAIPETIEIKTKETDEEKIIVAKKELNSRVIKFPETFTDNLSIKLEYIQPLRIREIDFGFDKKNLGEENHLRYLAQPGKSYSIYFNADRYINFNEGERPNLHKNEGVKYLFDFESSPNSLFVKSDIDEDGIFDEIDNCVSVENSDQKDIDSNGRGDACDDFDRDGLTNSEDNCVNKPNRNQEDDDLDGIGNVCDEKENRFFQSQTWLPVFSIIIVLIVTGGLIVITVKKKD